MEKKSNITEATIEASAKDYKTLKATNAIGKDDTVKLVDDKATNTSMTTGIKPMAEESDAVNDAVIKPQDKETIKYLSNVKDSKTGEVSKPFNVGGKNYQMIRGMKPNKEVVMAVYCHDEMDETGNNIIHPMEYFEENIAKKAIAEETKNNPWAICTASVGREDKVKYERCVMDIKKQHGISETMTEADYNADNFNSDERDFHDKENLRATEVPPVAPTVAPIEKPKELESGTAECIFEPNGTGGMEGFTSGKSYMYKLFDKGKNGKPYYRVYHDESYYETCGPNHFKKFFKKVAPSAPTTETMPTKVQEDNGMSSLKLAEYKHFLVNKKTGKLRKFKKNEELAKAMMDESETYMNLSELKKYIDGTLFGSRQKPKEEISEVDTAGVDQKVKLALEKMVQLMKPYVTKLITPAEKIQFITKLTQMLDLEQTKFPLLIQSLKSANSTSFGFSNAGSTQDVSTSSSTMVSANESIKEKKVIKTLKVKDLNENK